MNWDNRKETLWACIIIAIVAIVIIFVSTRPAGAEGALRTFRGEKYLKTSGEVEWDTELVKDLQRGLNKNLKAINRASGKKYGKLSVDGQLGPKTITMLKWFQKAKGLTPDGLCGKKTWAELGYNHAETVYYAPNLFVKLDRGTSDYSFLLCLDTHKFYVFEIKEDGWCLIKTFKAATGNSSKGYFTPIGSYVLGNSGNHSEISGDGWAADDATRITKNENGYFFVHSVLRHKKGGKWVYDDNSVLGESATHGCVRLSRENAKWVAEHRNGTAMVIVDRDPLR